MNVEFEDPDYPVKRIARTAAPASSLEHILCSSGLARTPKGARRFLVAGALLCILVSFMMIWFETISKPPVPRPPADGLPGRV